VTKQRWVWSDALKHHVIDRRIPVPAFNYDIKSLSAKELEVRALHAARFHQNWCSPYPRPRRCIEFQIEQTDDENNTTLSSTLSVVDPNPVTQVVFLPGFNGELLITLSGSHRVACWEIPLGSSQAFLIAERTLPENCTVEGLVPNDDPKSDAMLVVLYSQHGGQS